MCMCICACAYLPLCTRAHTQAYTVPNTHEHKQHTERVRVQHMHVRGYVCVVQQSVVVFIGWHYLSNTTCLIRPHLLYALFVVSMITIICQTIRHFEEDPR